MHCHHMMHNCNSDFTIFPDIFIAVTHIKFMKQNTQNNWSPVACILTILVVCSTVAYAISSVVHNHHTVTITQAVMTFQRKKMCINVNWMNSRSPKHSHNRRLTLADEFKEKFYRNLKQFNKNMCAINDKIICHQFN